MNIELVEYGEAEDWPIPFTDALNQSSKEWQQRLGLQYEPFSINIQSNRKKLNARGITGFINIENVNIEIKPKFLSESSSEKWRKLLWNILLFVENFSNNIFGEACVSSSSDADSFVDLLGWVFVRSIQESLLEGFPRGYKEQEGSFIEIRGNIDYSKISSILKEPFIFPCKYDEYSENIPVNKLLKWAGEVLAKQVKSFTLSNLLMDSIQHIQADGSQPPGLIESESLVLPAQFHYTEEALRIAKMLMKNEALQHRFSSMKSFGFLWKSHEIYEGFLYKILIITIKFFENNTYLKAQEKTTIATPFIKTDQIIIEYPDFKIKEGNSTIFVLDAKYKQNRLTRFSNHGLAKTEDINQVIVACKLEKCLHGVLVYPSGDTHGTYCQTWKLSDSGYPKYISNLYINLEIMYEPNGEYILAKQIFEELKALKEIP